MTRQDGNFPRLLLFTSEIPQTRFAGSMQLFRALQGYPSEYLRVVGPPIASGAQGLPCIYKTRRLLIYRLVCTRYRNWVTGLNALDLWPEPGLRATVAAANGFEPDLVVTVMDHLSFYKHAWKLARRLRAGFVTITMDDPQTFESAPPILQFGYDRLLTRLYASTALSIGVSVEMCEYLEKSFGRRATPFYFGPPEGMQPLHAESAKALRKPPVLTLGYAGSLGLGYREGIIALLPALAATNTRLHIYTHYQNIIEHPNIVNRGFLPPEQLWPTVQRECDAVVLPYAHEGDIQRVYRTHFPTKISEYCWLGMPILLCGPSHATGIRWGLRHSKSVLVATTHSLDVVGPLLDRLRHDADLRMRLGNASANVGRTEFDPLLVRRRFVELMREARDTHRTTPSP